MINPDTAVHKEDDALNDVVRRLRVSFSTHDPQHVHDVVHTHHQRLQAAPVRGFVAILVERASRSTLAS